MLHGYVKVLISYLCCIISYWVCLCNWTLQRREAVRCAIASALMMNHFGEECDAKISSVSAHVEYEIFKGAKNSTTYQHKASMKVSAFCCRFFPTIVFPNFSVMFLLRGLLKPSFSHFHMTEFLAFQIFSFWCLLSWLYFTTNKLSHRDMLYKFYYFFWVFFWTVSNLFLNLRLLK